jgi:hypothetical protein
VCRDLGSLIGIIGQSVELIDEAPPLLALDGGDRERDWSDAPLWSAYSVTLHPLLKTPTTRRGVDHLVADLETSTR